MFSKSSYIFTSVESLTIFITGDSLLGICAIALNPIKNKHNKTFNFLIKFPFDRYLSIFSNQYRMIRRFVRATLNIEDLIYTLQK